MYLRICMEDSKTAASKPKPNLPRRLFWDWRYDDIDWHKMSRSIIARVIERGSWEEWREMIRFYGYDNVVHALKTEILYLPDYAMVRVNKYFHIKKEDLISYQRKLTRGGGHWI